MAEHKTMIPLGWQLVSLFNLPLRDY